jgi:hypothetical protein
MCGCGKKSVPVSRVPALRPSVGPRPVVGGVAAGASPATIRALGLQQNTSPKSAMQMDAERRRIEKIRRDAIRAKLNK